MTLRTQSPNSEINQLIPFPEVCTNYGSIWFVEKQVGKLSKARVNGYG